MMIKEKIVDAVTGEETIIEREETKSETAERLAFTKKIEEQQIAEQNKQLARKAILDRIGITEEEAAILFQ